MNPSIRRRQFALAALFFLPGIVMASWVTRTPAIRDLLGASTAEMGLVLFGLSLGSMAGILSSGALVARFGARAVIAVGSGAIVVSVVVIGAGAFAESSIVVALGLFLFGAGMGGGEVAMNIEGAIVEQAVGKSFLPLLHGFFSLGTVVGAVAGIGFTAMAFPVVAHLGIAAGIGLVIVVVFVPGIARDTGKSAAAGRGEVRRRPRVWRDPTLVIIAVLILAMALSEGTANDWLPLIMVDGHGLDATLGSIVYAAFAASMMAGRFVGGWFVDRFGNGRVLVASAVFGIAGLAVVAFVDNPITASIAVVFWGLGASLGFPVALSAASESGPDAAARVAFAATIGYLAFLVGPPTLGLIGEEFGLRGALIVPIVVLVIAIAVAPRLIGAEARNRAERPLAEPPKR